jgi:ubiquinone/menaquinone biosynthesis C-methylase UbiE
MSNHIQAVNTTYEPLSREPEYIELNRGFVGRVALEHVGRFLDLACGAGTVSRLLLESAPAAHLNGIDLDPVQIDLATNELISAGYEVRRGQVLTDDVVDGKPVVTLAVGSADQPRFPDNTFDCATIANAIHMMPDKSRFLGEVCRVLKPGGLFGFNTAFYAGAYPDGPESRFHLTWMKEATLYIERTNQQLKAEGKEPVRRVHGTTRRAFQNRWLSPKEWCDLLEGHGFRVEDVHERVVMLDERCLAATGAYGGLAEVLLSGYPVEVASMALQIAVGTALESHGVSAIPHKWLEVWSNKA